MVSTAVFIICLQVTHRQIIIYIYIYVYKQILVRGTKFW